MAAVLLEHANDTIDPVRVIKMLLIHDIVEIDAGDTFLYDEALAKTQTAREIKAANRIFGLLPKDQAKEFQTLWHEFESADSSEAKFAKSLDKLMPLLHNYHTQGKSWKKHGIKKEKVLAYNKQIAKGSENLWQYTLSIIDDADKKGYFNHDDS